MEIGGCDGLKKQASKDARTMYQKTVFWSSKNRMVRFFKFPSLIKMKGLLQGSMFDNFCVILDFHQHQPLMHHVIQN